MSTIIITQFIFCQSYQEALSASKAFEDFSFKVSFLGERRTVRAKRFIRRTEGSKYYPYKVDVRYDIEYHGSFESYGFIDIKTTKCFPQIIDELKAAPEDMRRRIAYKYEDLDNKDIYDVYYYENFEMFFREKIISLLKLLNLACQVAFARQIETQYFEIAYEEKGSWYSRGYFAENSWERTPLFDSKTIGEANSFISVGCVWDWSQKHYYNKKEEWISEARAWVSLSNALNHIGYESLLYSIIGLEYVYTEKGRNIKQQLRESIPIVLKDVTSDEINNLYKIRSDFAHGSLAFPLYGESDYGQEYKNVNRAAAILLKTVRVLVKNDANRIDVINGEVHYIKDDTFSSRMEKEYALP